MTVNLRMYSVACGGPPEVWQNDPFRVGTSMCILGLDRSMALHLGYLAPLPGPLFLVVGVFWYNSIKAMTLCLVRSKWNLYSGNSFSVGAATRLGVSNSKL